MAGFINYSTIIQVTPGLYTPSVSIGPTGGASTYSLYVSTTNNLVVQTPAGGIYNLAPLAGPTGPRGQQGATVPYIFDGGTPASVYTDGPAFDCGGVD
jgi:hypothetical protein